MFGRKKTAESETTTPAQAELPAFQPRPARPAPLAEAKPDVVKPEIRPAAPLAKPTPIINPPSVPVEGSVMAEASPSPAPFRPDLARRPATAASTAEPPRPAAPPVGNRATPDPKTLIVGREISLNGQITACDRLLVEGKVEASLFDSRSIEISESGVFKGNADIEEADIRGRFDGKLSVSGRLMIRSTGKVIGEIRYGQIEIELGGQISGTIETTGKI
jgi:cytoskeletal protein CcmA (bactofilin family)